jgi:hypothetical protein
MPSGNTKGVGPTLQRKLEKHYPGWASLAFLQQAKEDRADYVVAPNLTADSLAAHLRRVPATRRDELLQVLALLVHHPDEPDYASRLAKLLGAPAKRALAG